MKQNATVTKILTNGMAEISVKRESACGGDCHACGGTCAFRSLMKVEAVNKISAAVGDKVMIESSTGGILTAAFIVYLMPIILFFASYATAATSGADEGTCILLSIIGFFVGVMIAVGLNRWYKKKQLTTFEIISILGR